MKMTLEKSIDYLFWRIRNGKYTPTEKDYTALVTVTEWINNQKAQALNEHFMFAKLYCHVFMLEIMHYKDIEMAQRSIHDLLNKPMPEHYLLFHQRLNEYELEKYTKHLGLNTKHPVFRSEEDNAKDKAILAKNQEAYMKHVQGLWEYSQVERSLNNQITNAINKYRHLP